MSKRKNLVHVSIKLKIPVKEIRSSVVSKRKIWSM